MKLSELRQLWVLDVEAADDGHLPVIAIHAPEACEAPCAYHSPSDHPLRDAPRGAVVIAGLRIPMRVCEHGVMHPDPDGLLHLHRIGVLAAPVSHRCCDGECCGGVM